MKELLSKIHFDSLLCFHCIAEQKSLTRAARLLGVSPPAVTHSLIKLENILGVSLCQRGRTGFRLTEEGRELFRRTKSIVENLNGYIEFLEDPDEFTGLVSIGLLDHYKNKLVQLAINTMVKKFPKAKLNFVVTSSENINNLVLSGELDIGFSLFFSKSDKLKYLKIGETTTHYYISRKHHLWKKTNIAKEDLYGENLMWVDNQLRTKAELDTDIFVNHPRYKMKVKAYTNQVDGALYCLRSGFAIVPLAPSLVDRLPDKKDIKRLTVNTKNPTYLEECVYNPNLGHSLASSFLIEKITELSGFAQNAD